VKYLSLFVPAFLCSAAVGIVYHWEIYDGSGLFTALLYLTAIAWIVLFVRRKIGNIWLLPLGFLPSWLPIFCYDAFLVKEWQYVLTLVIVLFYTIPFLLATLIIAIVVQDRKNKDRTGGDVP